MGVCEVTQAEYERVVGSNPSVFKTPTCPVESVNWEQASKFCDKLTTLAAEQASHAVYRLPTEAEWEYACRAGTSTDWYGTDGELGLLEQAWFAGNAKDRLHSVAQKASNAWGLYDMHGNVSEWTQDWLGTGYYATSPREDPTGIEQGSNRVYRGGNYSNEAAFCRAAFRGGHIPNEDMISLGFRVVRQVPSSPP